MNFKGKDCVSHMPKRLAGIDERMDNSCKRRAEYLHRSLVVVNTERSQWQASIIREKSVRLTEVSVTDQVLQEISKFPEILGELSMRKQCVPGSFFSAHTPEPGNEATVVHNNIQYSRAFLPYFFNQTPWLLFHSIYIYFAARFVLLLFQGGY